MLGLMRTAALQLASFGLTVDSLEPGRMRTEGMAAVGEDAIASMIERSPIGSLGDTEIADAAVFSAGAL
jgi:3-oxoacyl-[acyl-carrier protein] reductase